ncbi:TIGR02206 family membrane protein [Aquibacillus albus]|uniref:Integral membrane protein (TIGR02206 family) n=1 Tax=Aquibacillus albus TaxID=1168171 RepID=A0ABS2MYQ3_9BACI|nr:TIGR02206 family membrane protein [Aquibacillus albus]MBM7571029.1 putative integral membrane protein (TIGR02206 family) [Aquibacillus albus]
MYEWFVKDGNNPFILFSLTHILTLLFIIAICIGIYFFRTQLKKAFPNKIVRYSLAAMLIVSEISLIWWLNYIGTWSFRYSLPLHLSSISLLLSSVLLITRSYRLFEFTYFVGLGSALQAMVTPDIQAYTFPHFRYVHFFISHGGIVIANMFMVFVEGFRPTFKSIFKAFLYLNVYALLIFMVNIIMNSNYMYIMKKPANPSIIDYLGPWPFYIIPLEVIALATFWLLYIPFYIEK